MYPKLYDIDRRNRIFRTANARITKYPFFFAEMSSDNASAEGASRKFFKVLFSLNWNSVYVWELLAPDYAWKVPIIQFTITDISGDQGLRLERNYG